jgi:ligand-binding sensor domain-containing protein
MKKSLKILVLNILVIMLHSCNNKENIEPIEPFEDITPFDKHVTAIAIHNNSVWVGTYKNGVYEKDGDSWINYTKLDGLVSDTINALAISDSGVVWVGTCSGISKYEHEDWINYTQSDGLPTNSTYSLSFDNHGNVLIGCGRNKLIKFDGTSFSVTHVNQEVAGDGGHIHAITIDLEGNKWIGSCRSGLSMFDGQTWTHSIYGRSIFVRAIFHARNGDIWVGDSFGAHRLRDNTWTTYNESDGLMGNYSLCFTEDHHNNIWIGTTKGLSKYDGSEFSTYNHSPTALACDSAGDIWVCGSGISIITP